MSEEIGRSLGITTDITDEMLEHLSTAPDGILDAIVCEHLKKLIGRSDEERLLGIRYAIDISVYASLANGFALKVMHVMHEQLGGKMEDFRDPEKNPWRGEKPGSGPDFEWSQKRFG